MASSYLWDIKAKSIQSVFSKRTKLKSVIPTETLMALKEVCFGKDAVGVDSSSLDAFIKLVE